MTRTVLPEEIPEKTTPTLSAEFRDGNNTLIATLTTATLTLYNDRDGSIINSRNNFDVSASVSGGVLTFVLATADTAIVDTTQLTETHIALLQWTWDSGSKSGKHEIEMRVKNLTKIS